MKNIIILFSVISLLSCKTKNGISPFDYRENINSIVNSNADKGSAFFKSFASIINDFNKNNSIPSFETINRLRYELKSLDSLNKDAVLKLGQMKEFDNEIPIKEIIKDYQVEVQATIQFAFKILDLFESQRDLREIPEPLYSDVFSQLERQMNKEKETKIAFDKFDHKYFNK